MMHLALEICQCNHAGSLTTDNLQQRCRCRDQTGNRQTRGRRWRWRRGRGWGRVRCLQL